MECVTINCKTGITVVLLGSVVFVSHINNTLLGRRCRIRHPKYLQDAAARNRRIYRHCAVHQRSSAIVSLSEAL